MSFFGLDLNDDGSTQEDTLGQSHDELMAETQSFMDETRHLAEELSRSDFDGDSEPCAFGGTDGDPFNSSTDSLLNDANRAIRECREAVQLVRDRQNEQAQAMGLAPMTGDFSHDMHAQIDNVMELSDRAAGGNMEAQRMLENWEANTRRDMAHIEGETLYTEGRIEAMETEEFIQEGRRWLHEKEMERSEVERAQRTDPNDAAGFREHLDNAEAHRREAEDAARRRDELL